MSEACVLPTEDRPVRVAEFDDLFRVALGEQQRLSPTRLRWRLHPAAESVARELTRRESECCSTLLVPQDQDLGVLVVIAAWQQPQQRERVRDTEVGQANKHDAASSRNHRYPSQGDGCTISLGDYDDA